MNGPGPGDLGSHKNLEADLEVEWSGAVVGGLKTVYFKVKNAGYTKLRSKG